MNAQFQAQPLAFNPPVPVTMPVLHGHKTRRKRTTPLTKHRLEHVQSRRLEILGLEPLNTGKSSKSTIMEPAMPIPAPDEAVNTTSASQNQNPWSKLSNELQRVIFKHTSSDDLIALSLVSKHFRDLAAEELYRTFHIVFTDDDDFASDAIPDSLASGLDTFATSRYNYARYLKEIILETLSMGSKGEGTYKDYLLNLSCGKFMNTLLDLTLRKAKTLETFKWDIRVELSREVFKALHAINSLENLHLRMQAGSSIHQIPPPLPSSTSPIVTNYYPPPTITPSSYIHTSTMVSAPSQYFSSSGPSSSAASKASQKHGKSRAAHTRGPPPTFSGFKKLKTLAVLDMDSHEYLEELSTCIEKSAPTLKTLKLSLSESMANKSRKPPPDIPSDTESEVEDEFGQPILPPPTAGASDPNGPSKALKAQEEKKWQEAMLAKVLGWEPLPIKTKANSKVTTKGNTKVAGTTNAATEKKLIEDPKRRFTRDLKLIAKKLMDKVSPGTDLTAEGMAVLKMIEDATKLYLDNLNAKDSLTPKESKEKSTIAPSAEGSTAKGTPVLSTSSSLSAGDEIIANGNTTADAISLFGDPSKKKKPVPADTDTSNPDDIDIEEPEENDVAFEAQLADSSDVDHASLTPASSSLEDAVANMNLALKQKQERLEISEKGIGEEKSIETSPAESVNGDALAIQQQNGTQSGVITNGIVADQPVVKDLDDPLEKVTPSHKEALASSQGQSMSDYVRDTRGLTLSTLAIYLIPVKATVLCQSIDINVLQSLTLLNVGPQTPLWTALAKSNALSPLPLHKIHTDNVTLPFLDFVRHLNVVTELILYEKHSKSKVESTAAKTTITIEQIRKLALKKHIATLKVLFMKNDQFKTSPGSSDWDLNVKTVMLICQKAKNLEELGCVIHRDVYHPFLQFMPGLISLRALYVIASRIENDQCMYALVEFRKFLADNVSHNPHLKLEYIAMQDSIERLVRRKPVAKTPFEPKSKGKGKAAVYSTHGLMHDLLTNQGVPTWEMVIEHQNGEESSDEEEEFDEDGEKVNYSNGLRVETAEGLRFCDVPGVRMFERDVLTGTL